MLAVKDVIKNRSDSITNLDQLVDMLFGSSNTSEENIQNVVAESLGLLFIHHGMDMSAHYSDKFNSPSETMLTTIAKSLKFAVAKN